MMRRAVIPSLCNRHGYSYNDGHQRTKQTFLEGNYVDYGYDNIGQLKTAKGWESGGSVTRAHGQFGYAYDGAWNLSYRTNNALTQTFGVNSLNQLTNFSRSGTFTVAGAVSTTPTNVTVKDNANAPQAATVYMDETFARPGITLLNGTNVFQAVAKDSLGRTDTNTVTAYLSASAVCAYDSRGNLTNDGRRVFFYDSENQLKNVLVAGGWKSEFAYDGLMRRKVRKEFAWAGSAWVQTNEVRYVYDGRLVIEERHYTPQGSTLVALTTVTYTRGNDLSGSFEGAGGIGGLLARSEISNFKSPHSYYHPDGNGNVTALVNTNGFVVARYSYDPYGNLLGMSGPLAEANLYRFSSKEHHQNSGLVYYLYRFYEPGLQRWINRDPIGEAGGLNLHVFAKNAPSITVDIWGLRLIIVPGGRPEFPQNVACAIDRLSRTIVGERIQRDLPAKDILIIPGDEAMAGTASRDAPTGVMELNQRDPNFIPDYFYNDFPDEVPQVSPLDPCAGAAVTLGHELGHALYDSSDPENVLLYENPIRNDLGISPRPAYHGEALFYED
jgi:RHS repeat-associated protein